MSASRRGRRVDRDHDPAQRRRRREPPASITSRAEERVVAVLDQLAVRAPAGRAASRRSGRRRGSRNAGARLLRVHRRRRMGHHRRRVVDEPPQQRDRPRRRRHHLPRPRRRAGARTAACPRSPPACRHLPSSSLQAARELRPAQRLRILRGEGLRHHPVRPDEPPPRRRSTAAGRRRMDVEDARTAPSIITSRTSA